MSNARVVNISNADYHADTTAISHSGLDLVLADPAKYYHERIRRTQPAEVSEALSFGSMFHDAVLRPGEFGNGVVEIPPDVLSKGGARAGSAWKEFQAANPRKVLLKSDEPMMHMIRSIGESRGARSMIEMAEHFEHTIFWHDEEHDVERKARLDMLIFPKLRIIADLKSTSTAAAPIDCAYEAAKWGYHRQQEFYKDACEELYGGPRFDFVFIFVAKESPYRTTVVRLPNKWIDIGRAQNAKALKTYSECLKSGRWLPEDHGQIIDVDPPGYLERPATEWETTQ